MASNKRDVHIVFLGPTGCGKSRLCNFLLNDDTAFEVNSSFQSVTKGIQTKWTAMKYNNELIVFKFIDTQGLADTTMTSSEVIKIVKEAVAQNVNYVNYFVIVLRPGRMTDENRNALEYIIKAFKLDDNERKKHVYFLLSHCECSNDQLQKKYREECLADRTIKRVLVVEQGKVQNLNFIGLPQPNEVNSWMYQGMMQWMGVQRKTIMDYLSEPIEGIQPVRDGVFENLCTII